MKRELKKNFKSLNVALTSIYEELKRQELWNNVTVVVVSDFARTLTPNSGDGSDHAWGGHYFLMGGSVKGGQIHGQYPADITDSGPLNLGRGRMIPTTSWDSMFHSVVEWMGAETEEEKDDCLPNREQTGTKMYSKSEVFDS